MRIAVTGLSGNVGSQLLPRLLADPAVTSVAGLARRPPDRDSPLADGVDWHAADLGDPGCADAVARFLRGADAVVHLAWRVTPAHDRAAMQRVNVEGTRTVIRAALDAGVDAFVHASSVGAYSHGPADKGQRVDEAWPTGGLASSAYSRDKVAAERMLDEAEAERPDLRVVRVRPAIVLQRQAAAEQARYFLGPFVPASVVRAAFIPLVPDHERFQLQVVHAEDVADVFARAAVSDAARGGLNVADEPVLDPPRLAELLGARRVPVSPTALRAFVDATWRLHVQPTDPGWVDLAFGIPLLDTAKVRRELGWAPTRDAGAVLLEALSGVADGAGGPSAVLRPLGAPAERLLDAFRTLLPGRGGTQ
ncbi:MAG: NAD-dependent epimerase/dehydratase family protein [Actinomycetota bacterium]|jgi:UDP-glucose 4-epimerase|nr:NAD-dependent epimerase/dehydratase family protein [Actinomycetota bacterium]